MAFTCSSITEEILLQYHKGDLDEIKKTALVHHLEGCLSCRKRYDQCARTFKNLRQAFFPPPLENRDRNREIRNSLGSLFQLNCKDITPEELYDYLTGEVTSLRDKLISRHLEKCSKCQKRKEEALVLQGQIRQALHRSSPPQTYQGKKNCAQEIWKAARHRKKKDRRIQLVSAISGLAATILLGLGLWISVQKNLTHKERTASHYSQPSSSKEWTNKKDNRRDQREKEEPQSADKEIKKNSSSNSQTSSKKVISSEKDEKKIKKESSPSTSKSVQEKERKDKGKKEREKKSASSSLLPEEKPSHQLPEEKPSPHNPFSAKKIRKESKEIASPTISVEKKQDEHPSFLLEEKELSKLHSKINSEKKIVGDLNSDGRINATDTMLLARFLTRRSQKETTTEEEREVLQKGDYNSDGKLSVLDIMAMTKTILKQ